MSGPKVAVISDIHANLEALDAVLADCAEKSIARVYSLGDVVGYGPNPAECLDRARDFTVNLMGNHEEAVLKGAYGFNPVARGAIEWTRNQLRPRWHSPRDKRDRWEFMKSFLLRHQEGSVLFVHGSPRDPTTEYILRTDVEDCFGEPPAKIREIFALVPGLCFVGHSHFPGVVTESCEFLTPRELDGRFVHEPGVKAVVNVGSVGQPRDGDVRACYVLYDGRTVEYVRVQYDVEKTIAKIRAIPELPVRSAERLRYGT